MKKIRILLIEDNRFLRDGIASMLKKQPDMQIATIANGENILPTIGKLNSNIVILDLGLKNQKSLQVVELIKKHNKDTKIIMMNLIPLEADVLEFVRAGVSGFILEDASIAEFLKTIRSVNYGVQVLPAHLTGSLFSQIVEHAISEFKPSKVMEGVRMSNRERQVIELIADGSTNKEIAKKLHISTYTVKSHVHNILEKLSLHTRVQIAKYTHTINSSKTENDTNSLISDN